MPVFIERYILPVLAGVILTVVVADMWELTWPARTAVAAASIISAFALAYLLQRSNRQNASASPRGEAIATVPVPLEPLRGASFPRAVPTTAPLPEEPSRETAEDLPFSPFMPATPSSTSTRTYIKIDPDYLRKISAEFTSIHADKIRAAYRGNWIRVKVPVHDIIEKCNGKILTRYSSIGMRRSLKLNLEMEFKEDYRNRLTLLRPGYIIIVDGKIDAVGLITIELADCELVD